MTEKTKYLYENKEIGDVLAQGFAKICQQKPQFPINYLARFLKNYSINKMQKTHLIDKLEHNKLVHQKIKQLFLENQTKQLAKIQTQKRKQEEKNKFLNLISSEKQPESILNGFCQWLCSNLELSAVYVGELEYQSKNIDLMKQDGEEAHLQMEKDKIIRFKYASKKQHGVIVGQSLGLDSVVGKLLTQVPENQGQQGSPQDQEGNQIKPLQSQNASIYLSSVVGNQQLKFFTFPKLGSYFATVMNIKSYLSEKLVDENAQKIQNYRKLVSEYEKEMEERQTKFKEQYEQKVHSGADQKQLQQMEQQFQTEKNSTPKPTQQSFSYTQRKFIICADTLGQDRQITLEERNQLIKLIKHLNTSWQNQQQSQLTDDIEKQLSLFAPSHDQGHDGQIPNYQQQLTTLFEEEEKDINSHEEVQKVKDNQKLLQLELNNLRFEKTKQYLTEEKYLKFWNHLLSLNILKYQQILKQYLILLGFSKKQFSLPNSNQLDWLKTKNLIKSSQTIMNQKLHTLTPRGSKPQIIPSYAKCSRINKNIENFQLLTVANYNIYLALILRLLQLYTKTRQQDRQARVIKIFTQRQLRQQRLRQAEAKVNEKKQKLDTLKAELQEKGQLQTFDQQVWSNQYDQQNPPIEVPEQVADDNDNDLEEIEDKQLNL